MKLYLSIELETDIPKDDLEAYKRLINDVLFKPNQLRLHSLEIGDEVGPIKVIEIKDDEGLIIVQNEGDQLTVDL